MNINIPSSSEITGVVEKIGKTAGFPLGVIYGATAQYPVQLSTADFEQRLVDTIAEITGMKLTLGGHTAAYPQTFKLTGWLNKGLWGYLAVWAYDELGLPFSKAIKNTLGNFLIGYAVGGIFDPPVPQPGNGYFIGGGQGLLTSSGGFGSSLSSQRAYAQPDSGGGGRSYANLVAAAPAISSSIYTTGGAVF